MNSVVDQVIHSVKDNRAHVDLKERDAFMENI